MKYFRYSLMRDELHEETIYCRNELGYYRFLDDMNSKEIHSKYFSRVDRDMHKEGKKIVMERNKGRIIDDELELE